MLMLQDVKENLLSRTLIRSRWLAVDMLVLRLSRLLIRSRWLTVDMLMLRLSGTLIRYR